MESYMLLKSNRVLFVVFISLILGSCGERSPLLPNVTGRAGEVVVVMNDPIWQSEGGEALGELLVADYLFLPQYEPRFDVVRIGHNAFSNIFKTHRNIIIINVSENFSETRMHIKNNVWSKPQLVIEIYTHDTGALHTFVENQGSRILEEIENIEIERIQNYNRQYERRELRERLSERFDLSLTFPPGYVFAVDTTDFAWLVFSPATQERIQGVMVYQYDYVDPDTFTPEFLVNKRNQFLRQYVAGPSQNSWMTTEMEFFPIFNEFMKDDLYFAELRGLWKVQNDFMGGPFVSHTTLDMERNRVITVEGFVFEPQEKKRNLMRQVEGIIRSLKID